MPNSTLAQSAEIVTQDPATRWALNKVFENHEHDSSLEEICRCLEELNDPWRERSS